MHFMDDGGFADARKAGNKHQFGAAVSHPFEGR